MRWGLLGLLLALAIPITGARPAAAASLTVQPLQYDITLKVGERQKGFVDITNPSPESVVVTTSVQAFRQVDDHGSVQFFSSAAVTAGVIPDLQEFELGPRETIRLFFIVDGTKLPSGDVFAALFATVKPQRGADESGSRQTVRVVTILSIVNGTPGAREATVTDLSVGFWQFGADITGNYTVKNTADPTTTTGFYPVVNVAMSPFRVEQTVPSKLVYAGHSRENSFSFSTQRFGLYEVTAQFNGSSQSRWVFVANGVWLWALGGSAVAVAVGGGWLAYRHARRRSAARQ